MTLRSTQQKGFTLIEMIVSIALFIVVALVAIGAVLKVIDANKKSQTLKTTISNLNFALDTMTREMRVGNNYECFSASSGAVSNGSISGVPTEISSGSSVPCNPPLSGSWLVAFNSSKTAVVGTGPELCRLVYAYYFDGPNSSLWKGEQEECGQSIKFFPMIYNTSDADDSKKSEVALVFTSGFIKVLSGGNQPFVQVRFSGYAGTKEKIRSYFDVQTSISQRLPD